MRHQKDWLFAEEQLNVLLFKLAVLSISEIFSVRKKSNIRHYF